MWKFVCIGVAIKLWFECPEDICQATIISPQMPSVFLYLNLKPDSFVWFGILLLGDHNSSTFPKILAFSQNRVMDMSVPVLWTEQLNVSRVWYMPVLYPNCPQHQGLFLELTAWHIRNVPFTSLPCCLKDENNSWSWEQVYHRCLWLYCIIQEWFIVSPLYCIPSRISLVLTLMVLFGLYPRTRGHKGIFSTPAHYFYNSLSWLYMQ